MGSKKSSAPSPDWTTVTTFTEAAVRRDVAGRFDTHPHSAPELHLPERTGADFLDEQLAAGEPVDIHPRGLAATRRAVRNLRGEPGDGIRIVSLDWDSIPPGALDDRLDVAGPNDGRPLVINVTAGCPRMTVTRGHVIVLAGGNGFGIEAQDGARVTVLGEPGHKVSVTARAGSRVDFYAEDGVRGYQHFEEGTDVTVHGDSSTITIGGRR